MLRVHTSATLSTLARYDTPTVCNVIELFDVRPRSAGFMDRRISAAFPDLPPMVGYASTATFRASCPASAGAYASLDQQVATFGDLPGPAVVVFQDLDEPPAAATFGEIMCSAYKAFGAAGLVTSGAGRDLDQVRAIDFPVFTSGAICAHGNCHVPRIGLPVEVGGITVHPSDLIHGDRNGVTTVPHDIAADVADACAGYVDAESVVLSYLRGDSATPDGFAAAMAECGRRIERLKQAIRRP